MTTRAMADIRGRRLRALGAVVGAGVLLSACMPPPIAHETATEQTTTETLGAPTTTTVTTTKTQQSP